MLSKWVVETYKTLVELALWVFLITGGLFGAAIGGMIGHGFLGFLLGAVAAFFGMAVFLGAALVLGEIQTSVRQIENTLRQVPNTAGVSPSRDGEPSKNPQESEIRHMGMCPNCDSKIPIDSQECPTCKAEFGPSSSWKVRRS